MFSKILIANRGEIAVRIARTCRTLGIETVAVYSDADRRALHVLEADRAVHIGGAALAESYLNIDAIIEAARSTGAEAIHPGYGLLSENPAFAAACEEAGIVFIGPPAEVIRIMGDKAEARRLAEANGVPVVPGYNGEDQSNSALLARAKEIGFPIMIKAVAGGGGRGMRLVEDAKRFIEALEAARRESQNAFGDDRLLLERAIVGGRHVEVQILADAYGAVIHLGERDCSVQRRHQKVIEESPSPAVDAELRERMGAAAVRLASGAKYVNAGTVEFLLAQDGSFYFLEMNTRLQVEHGVTELVTGLDIVAQQLAIASGQRLRLNQGDLTFRGHAIECRVYAEDPSTGYLPSPGTISRFEVPEGEGIRNDVGTYAGDTISTYYDPMLAKVLTWGSDRNQAVYRMAQALGRYRIEGVKTNLSLLRAIIAHPVFRSGRATTRFLESELSPERLIPVVPREPLLAAFGALVVGLGAKEDPWQQSGPRRPGGIARADFEFDGAVYTIEGRRVVGSVREWTVALTNGERRVRFEPAGHDLILMEVDGETRSLRVHRSEGGIEVFWAGRSYLFRWSFGEEHHGLLGSPLQKGLTAPMPGLVLKVLVRPGQKVRAHQTLVVLEAMKMEHAIEAPYDGVVTKVHCVEGGRVAEGVVLVELLQEAP
jgi:3-methylcrotonyl-CoA carboxylase alpha subunit